MSQRYNLRTFCDAPKLYSHVLLKTHQSWFRMGHQASSRQHSLTCCSSLYSRMRTPSFSRENAPFLSLLCLSSFTGRKVLRFARGSTISRHSFMSSSGSPTSPGSSLSFGRTIFACAHAGSQVDNSYIGIVLKLFFQPTSKIWEKATCHLRGLAGIPQGLVNFWMGWTLG